MDNKEFDDIIKEKLESLSTSETEGAWDLFKEKWDNDSYLTPPNTINPSDQDAELDAKIKKDMQGLRMPFNSKHWIILKEQLELEALFKKKLFVAKSVELIILAFLVMGILNLWPIQQDYHHIPMYDIAMVASVPVSKESAEKHETLEKAKLAHYTALKEQIYTSTKELVGKMVAPIHVTDYDSATKETIDVNRTKEKHPSIKSNLPANSNQTIIPFINDLQNGNERAEGVVPFLDQKQLQPMAVLSPSALEQIETPTRPLGFPDIVLKNKALDKENTYISFALGPKVNLVNSPFDPVYEFDPYNTITTNFNISAKIQKEIGPIEVYTGLGYTNTSYVPKLVDEIYEPLERQFNVAKLENIQFKTFNIPVGLKYNIIESDKYEVYTTAGIDLNVIADSEYTIQDQPVGRFQPLAPPSPKNTVNEKAKLSQKEFNKGILAGGSLKDNLYASASVGFGLNWKVSDNSGLFIEPRYSHYVSSNGIGPNADKVHGVSIDLGFRYQIN